MLRGTRLELFSVAILPFGLGLAIYGAPTPAVDPAGAAFTVAGDVSFASDVAPMFAEQCVSCHGDETAEAGLRLDSYEAAMRGSEYGPVIEAGDPGNSLLLDMISAGEMPQEADQLDDDVVEMVRDWIEAGAENN
jgi:mono/diheme cytochrome c family protein